MGCGGSTLAASITAAEDAAAPSIDTDVEVVTEEIKLHVRYNDSHIKPPAAAGQCPLHHISPQQEEHKQQEEHAWQQEDHIRQEEHLGHTMAVSRCPMGHGSVGAAPFPGYVHGGHPAICVEGCKPDPLLGKNGRSNETPIQTLIREALEYQDLYHKENGSTGTVKSARIAQILDEIQRTGMYTHTFDELQHGARVAWRNAPKCCNRKFWEELKLLDGRKAKTPTEMYSACLEVLERATLSCVTTANVAVFRPQTPATKDGPRVWNNQLIRYAGYKQPDGSVLGDPAEVEFTEMVIKQFGWVPPPQTEGSSNRFDILPLLLQPHPDEPPQLFHVPDQYVVRVPIHHPDSEAFSNLGLEWYTVPAVSNMELSVGGLTYTAVPFNGWYADTEVVRNLTDASRFNMCAQVAAAMNLDITDDASMWRDRAIVELDVAVMHSFRQAGMGMVDHHTLMRNFFVWWNKEKSRRGYSPGNWKWIITPISPTASRCYLELNKMTEYTLKPGYWYAPGWRQYNKALLARMPLLRGPSSVPNSRTTSMDTVRVGAPRSISMGGRKPMDNASNIVIMYATVTGNTQQYAEAVTAALSGPGSGLSVTLLSMDDFESDHWSECISIASAVLVMSSTHGPGAPPNAAKKFIAWLQSSNNEAREAFAGKPTCVLGFGSSCYPRFCAAAGVFHSLLLSAGATAMMGVTKVDALSGEEQTVWAWVQSVVQKLSDMDCINGMQAADLVQRLPVTDIDKPPEFHQEFRLIQLQGEGLQPARERGCHWATVLEATEQLRDTSNGASTKLIKLDISTGAVGNYISGDEVCIWGENEPGLVQRFAAQLGIPAEQLDDLFLLQRIEGGDDDLLASAAKGRFPLPNSYRTVLTRHVGLSERISFAAIAGLAGCAPTDELLQKVASSYAEYSTWCSDVLPRWQDLFKLFPTLVLRVPLATFFQLCPVIKPRYYSISSSGAVTPRQVAVTVGRLSYKLHTGEQRDGFCSSFLSRVEPGDRLRLKLVSQPAFRMPLNLTAPVIMVAAGTGLAPFRGFWHERLLRLQQEQQLGPAMLVFGCRNMDKDLILKEEMEAMAKQGAVQHLLLALSRDKSMPKTYVQDLIKQKAGLLKATLLHERCHVYVCGSSNMAQEVSSAMVKVAGKEALDVMLQEGRYHEDVFGMNIADHKAARQKAAQLQAIKSLAAQSLAAIQPQLDKGLDVNAVDETGSALLHHACSTNRMDLVFTLLARDRVNTNIASYMGLTPAAEAAVAGHAKLTAVLEAHGCSRVSPMHKSFYALHAAVLLQDKAALTAALAQGMDPNQQDYHMVSPLHLAVVLGYADMAVQLLEAGADPNLQNRLGMTPLQLAVARDRQALIPELRARGATIQATHIIAAVNPAAKQWSADTKGNLLEGAGVMPEDVARVQALWAYVSGEAYPNKVKSALEQFGVNLFLALFEMYPNLLPLFPFKDADGKPIIAELAVHGLKVASTLGELVNLLQNPAALLRFATDLVERHYQYGVELVHYDMVLGALGVFLEKSQEDGAKVSAEDKAAWRRVLNILKIVAVGCYNNRAGASTTTAGAGS